MLLPPPAAACLQLPAPRLGAVLRRMRFGCRRCSPAGAGAAFERAWPQDRAALSTDRREPSSRTSISTFLGKLKQQLSESGILLLLHILFVNCSAPISCSRRHKFACSFCSLSSLRLFNPKLNPFFLASKETSTPLKDADRMEEPPCSFLCAPIPSPLSVSSHSRCLAFVARSCPSSLRWQARLLALRIP